MIFPMMVAVDFASLRDIGQKPKGLARASESAHSIRHSSDASSCTCSRMAFGGAHCGFTILACSPKWSWSLIWLVMIQLLEASRQGGSAAGPCVLVATLRRRMPLRQSPDGLLYGPSRRQAEACAYRAAPAPRARGVQATHLRLLIRAAELRSGDRDATVPRTEPPLVERIGSPNAVRHHAPCQMSRQTGPVRVSKIIEPPQAFKRRGR